MASQGSGAARSRALTNAAMSSRFPSGKLRDKRAALAAFFHELLIRRNSALGLVHLGMPAIATVELPEPPDVEGFFCRFTARPAISCHVPPVA